MSFDAELTLALRFHIFDVKLQNPKACRAFLTGNGGRTSVENLEACHGAMSLIGCGLQ